MVVKWGLSEIYLFYILRFHTKFHLKKRPFNKKIKFVLKTTSLNIT